MNVLAVTVLVSWFVVAAALASGDGSARGLHILAAPVLSIVLAIAELAA